VDICLQTRKLAHESRLFLYQDDRKKLTTTPAISIYLKDWVPLLKNNFSVKAHWYNRLKNWKYRYFALAAG